MVPERLFHRGVELRRRRTQILEQPGIEQPFLLRGALRSKSRRNITTSGHAQDPAEQCDQLSVVVVHLGAGKEVDRINQHRRQTGAHGIIVRRSAPANQRPEREKACARNSALACINVNKGAALR